MTVSGICRHPLRCVPLTPAGHPVEALFKFVEVRNVRFREAQDIETLQKRRCDTTGEDMRLAREQPVPSRVLIPRIISPRLRNRPIGRRAGRLRVFGCHLAL